MKIIAYAGALTLSLSGPAFAGYGVASPTPVPALTPWGTIIAAAALGATGIYTFLRKRK